MSGVFRFGAFELDSDRVELRKSGVRVRLQEQPFRILMLLLSARGAVVTREELRTALWPENTFVEFDHGLNAAVARLRETLGDSSGNPRFIETVPRRGYRFIAPIQIQTAEQTEQTVLEPESQHHQAGRFRGLSWAALLGIVSLGVSALALFAWRVQNPGNAPIAIPLTTYAGLEFTPSFSPDGDRVAFAWDGNGRDFDIYIKQIGSEQPLRLTDNPADDLQPAWSPDGRSIAFLRVAPGTATGTIMVVPAIGGAERRIGEMQARNPLKRRLLAWLPDHHDLVIADKTTEEGPSKLFRVSILTGERRQITFPPDTSSGDDGPSISPDHRHLAFARQTNAAVAELFVVELSEDFAPLSEPKQITHLEKVSTDPVWTTDGTELMFFSGSQHGRRLFRVRSDGSASARPMFPSADVCGGGVAFSRVRGRLVYSSSNWDVNVWRADLRSSATRPQVLIQSTQLDHLPVISPDGSRIAFITNRSGKQDLWTCRADASDCAPLVFLDGEVGFADWSPDGRSIAFSSQVKEFKQVFVVPSNGGQPRQITSGPSNNEVPTWSSDGEWLYFSSDREEGRQIWKVAATAEAHSQPVRLTRHGGTRALESPDGKYLYYATGNQPARLFRSSVDAKHEILLVDSIVNMSTFTVSREGVYFVAKGPQGRQSLQFLPLNSSWPVTVTVLAKPVAYGMDVSSDGRSLLFAQYDREEEDLMMIENFR